MRNTTNIPHQAISHYRKKSLVAACASPQSYSLYLYVHLSNVRILLSLIPSPDLTTAISLHLSPRHHHCRHRNPNHLRRPPCRIRLPLDRRCLHPRRSSRGSAMGQAFRYLGPQTHSPGSRGLVCRQLHSVCPRQDHRDVNHRPCVSRHCRRGLDPAGHYRHFRHV